MNEYEIINQRVAVILVHQLGEGINSCYPAKMKYQGHEVTFIELGLRHPTSKGKRMIHVFDVTDGANDYRLEYDAEQLTWTLVSMLAGRYEH